MSKNLDFHITFLPDKVDTPKRLKVKVDQKTPGKISSYFKINGTSSVEKGKEVTTPVRSSPRLKNKVFISPLSLSFPPSGSLYFSFWICFIDHISKLLQKIATILFATPKQCFDVRIFIGFKFQLQFLKSPVRESSRRLEAKPKPLSFDVTSPEKIIPSKRILTRSPNTDKLDKQENSGLNTKNKKQKQGSDNNNSPICTRNEGSSRVNSNAVTIATQTTPPFCGGGCTRCCYKVSPVFTPTLTHTPVDSTPTSCSSIHRKQSRQTKDNIDTTPTKG